METALELFAENGFHATSISQIAKKANISKGLTYNYFESKNDILNELVDEGFHEIYDMLDPNHDGVLTEDEFIGFIENTFDTVKRNHKHWKLFFTLMIQPAVSNSFSERYSETFDPIFKIMYEYIESKGSDDPEGDLMAISAMIEGAFLYVIVAPEIFPIDVMKNKITKGIFKILNTNNKPQ